MGGLFYPIGIWGLGFRSWWTNTLKSTTGPGIISMSGATGLPFHHGRGSEDDVFVLYPPQMAYLLFGERWWCSNLILLGSKFRTNSFLGCLKIQWMIRWMIDGLTMRRYSQLHLMFSRDFYHNNHNRCCHQLIIPVYHQNHGRNSMNQFDGMTFHMAP